MTTDQILKKLFKYFLPTFISVYLIWFIWNPVIFNQLCIIAALSIISWTIAYYFYETLNQETIDPTGKIVLVTGCDTGFGNRTAFRLDQLGFHVFAGVLFPDGEGAQQLREKCSKRLRIIRMDVTKPDEVTNVIEEIEKTNLPLWALVNNAGIAVSIPFDWGNDIDAHRKIFDVNLFGLIRCTKYCMPLLRKSNGRVINIASAAARIQAADLSHYCMAKHSVRVFSDCMRRELIDTDIKIITIEPSFYRTEIINEKDLCDRRQRYYDETPSNIKESYGEKYLVYLNVKSKKVDKMMKYRIDDVVDSIIDGIIRCYPKYYYRCCSYSEIFSLWGLSHMPEIIFDYLSTIGNRKLMRKIKCGPYAQS